MVAVIKTRYLLNLGLKLHHFNRADAKKKNAFIETLWPKLKFNNSKFPQDVKQLALINWEVMGSISSQVIAQDYKNGTSPPSTA